MARIRITLEDDDGREINGDKERLDDLSGGTKRFVDIEAAVESFKQEALPELTAELLTLAQHQFVAEVKKRVLSQSSIFGQNSKIWCQGFNDLQTPKCSKRRSRTWPLRVMFRGLSQTV